MGLNGAKARAGDSVIRCRWWRLDMINGGGRSWGEPRGSCGVRRWEEREPDVSQMCLTKVTSQTWENGKLSLPPTLLLPAGFQRSQVRSSAATFWALFYFNLLYLSGRGSFEISLWFEFSHTEMTQKKKKKSVWHSETCAPQKPALLFPSPMLTRFPLYLSSWWA